MQMFSVKKKLLTFITIQVKAVLVLNHFEDRIWPNYHVPTWPK